MAKAKKTAPQRAGASESGATLLAAVGDDPATLLMLIDLMERVIARRPRRGKKKTQQRH